MKVLADHEVSAWLARHGIQGKGPAFLNWEGELLDVWMPEGNHEPLLRAIERFKRADG